MSDETRLLSREGEATEFEKELLGSWNAEQPSDEARARVLAMAALGAGVAAAAGTAAKAGAAGGGSIAPTAAAAGTATIVKWLVVAAVGAVTAGTTLAYHRFAHRAPAAPAEAAPVPSPPPRAEIAVPVPATSAVPSATPGGPPPGGPAVQTGLPARSALPLRHPSSVGSGDKGARAADDALGEEVSALDRARRALAGGDAAGALRQLDDFEARFPRGALGEEAEALRIESLLAENDRAAAARVGARFLAAHPNSPHAERVRSLLARAPVP
jgi:hypothetical protein